MNQILYNKDNPPKHTKNTASKKHIFKFQFMFSCVLALVIITGYFIHFYNKESKENLSQKIKQNYNISRLYSNGENSNNNVYEENGTRFAVIGIIEIPKIGISYPILSEHNDDLLKIAPCKISGPSPNENGNLCIAAHNYDNYKFFSKISTLSKNDEILIYGSNGNKVSYYVFDSYEVLEDNLSPLELPENEEKQVTLITCNNINSNRIIVKACNYK